MHRGLLRLGRRFPWAILISVILVVLLGAAGTSFSAKGGNGGGGGGKPPKDDPPPPTNFQPVIAYGGISVSDVDGLNRTDVTPGDSPSWSPDGTELAFVGSDGSVYTVSIFENGNFSVGTPVPITPIGKGGIPYWSPESNGSSWIAYIDVSEVVPDVWVVRPDGTGRQRLTQTPNRGEKVVSWSPDGTRMAVSGGSVGDDFVTIDILELAEAGNGLTVVNILPDILSGTTLGGRQVGGQILWSNTEGVAFPQGRLIVDLPDEGGDLWFVPVHDPAEAGLLMPNVGAASSWSPDDTEIMFGYGWWSAPDPCTGKNLRRDAPLTMIATIGVNPAVHCDNILLRSAGNPNWWRGP